ncbi:MAG: hypothetical protein JKY65_03480 [Planctomycetes bacterium]|nr:hypothetical protein [Planctomycetota bacterium]
MPTARKLRVGVALLNLVALVAIGVASWTLVRGPSLGPDPLEGFSAERYSLNDVQPKQRDLSVIGAALDRPLPKRAEPAAVEVAPTETLPPPPVLLLVAVLPDEEDGSRSLAIVRRPDGTEQLLLIGDQIGAEPNVWRVAAMKVTPLGDHDLGVLTLEGESRLQAYEAVFHSS